MNFEVNLTKRKVHFQENAPLGTPLSTSLSTPLSTSLSTPLGTPLSTSLSTSLGTSLSTSLSILYNKGRIKLPNGLINFTSFINLVRILDNESNIHLIPKDDLISHSSMLKEILESNTDDEKVCDLSFNLNTNSINLMLNWMIRYKLTKKQWSNFNEIDITSVFDLTLSYRIDSLSRDIIRELITRCVFSSYIIIRSNLLTFREIAEVYLNTESNNLIDQPELIPVEFWEECWKVALLEENSILILLNKVLPYFNITYEQINIFDSISVNMMESSSLVNNKLKLTNQSNSILNKVFNLPEPNRGIILTYLLKSITIVE